MHNMQSPLVVFTCNFLHNVNCYSLGTPWLETTKNVITTPPLSCSVSPSKVCSEMGVSVCVLVTLTQLLVSATTEHVVYSGKTQEGGGEGVCPGDQQTRTVLDEIEMEVRGVVKNIILPSLAPIGSIGQRYNPTNSCSEISELVPGQSSGYYWVRSHNGTAVQVYCDMDGVCGCSSTGGWTVLQT